MLPTKKTSKSRTRSRRSHHSLRAANYCLCAKCGSAKMPHSACAKCGYVNSKITLKVSQESES